MLGRPARWVIYLSLVMMTTTNVSYVSIHNWRTYQLANQIQSTIWSVLLNAEFNAPQARAKLMQKKHDARYVSIYASRNNEDAVDDNLVL